MEDNSTSVLGSPIYEQLAARIRKLISEGDYQAGQMLGSEHELARRENISRMTVRRASEMLVHEGLLERRPGKGLFVRHTGGTTTRLVQVIAGNLQWVPGMEISRGAQTVARQRGIQIQLYDAHGDMELDVAVLRQLPSGLAAGAIVMSLHNPTFNEAVYELKVKGFPFVLVDQRLQDIEVTSVTADNRSGGYQVGKAILELGHRRVAYIGDLFATTARDRLVGFQDAHADAGLPFNRSLVVDLPVGKDPLGDWSACVTAATKDLMSRPAPPTALFCSCDAVARSASRALMGMGIRIPQDVSLVGFDDDPLAEWLTPALTTVRQPFSAMGQAAIEALCKRMANPAAAVEHLVLPVALVRRASLAAPGGTVDAEQTTSTLEKQGDR